MNIFLLALSVAGLALLLDGLLIVFVRPYFQWWSERLWKGKSDLVTAEGKYFYNRYVRGFKSIAVGVIVLFVAYLVSAS